MAQPQPPEHMTCHHTGHMRKCHKLVRGCWKWVEIRGTNPNTGESTSQWGCADAFGPLMQIEIAKEVRQGAAATESFRNAAVGPRAEIAQDVDYKQIEGGR